MSIVDDSTPLVLGSIAVPRVRNADDAVRFDMLEGTTAVVGGARRDRLLSDVPRGVAARVGQPSRPLPPQLLASMKVPPRLAPRALTPTRAQVHDFVGYIRNPGLRRQDVQVRSSAAAFGQR